MTCVQVPGAGAERSVGRRAGQVMGFWAWFRFFFFWVKRSPNYYIKLLYTIIIELKLFGFIYFIYFIHLMCCRRTSGFIFEHFFRLQHFRFEHFVYILKGKFQSSQLQSVLFCFFGEKCCRNASRFQTQKKIFGIIVISILTKIIWIMILFPNPSALAGRQ